jgi:hypothetical protein
LINFMSLAEVIFDEAINSRNHNKCTLTLPLRHPRTMNIFGPHEMMDSEANLKC